MIDKTLPKIIKEQGLDFHWTSEKVWQVDLPVEEISLDKLIWQFDLPFWQYGNKKYAISPNQVIKNPKKYSYQYQRTIKSDLKHPIDIMKNKHGKWEALDGLHRTLKAYILGMKTVKVRKFDRKNIKFISN